MVSTAASKPRKASKSAPERVSKQDGIELLRRMSLIREFELACGEHYTKAHIRGFLHLYIGQEATAVGALADLNDKDYVVTHYRDHGHALAHGLDVNRSMAELFGRSGGLSKGKGGSMHLFDAKRNFMGGHAIVGAHLPLAVGTAWAQSHLGSGGVTMCFFGDGSTGQGVYHESLNLASLWDLPLIFYLENNEFGMGTAIERARAVGNNLRAGIKEAYGIETHVVDGMDVLAVRELTRKVVKLARAESRPHFIEAKTYRFEGHSLADGVKYRTNADLDPWLKRDPLVTFPKLLMDQGLATKAEIEKVFKSTRAEVDKAIQFALDSPEPEERELWDDIYA